MYESFHNPSNTGGNLQATVNGLYASLTKLYRKVDSLEMEVKELKNRLYDKGISDIQNNQ
jgi:regulator of replication initiation timing